VFLGLVDGLLTFYLLLKNLKLSYNSRYSIL
jgi:hypothetical protein